MKRYIIHVAFAVIMVGILVYTCLVCGSKSYYDKNYSENFIKSIKYIKDGDYVKSYENIKNSSNEEKEIIQTIFLCEFSKERDKYLKISSEIMSEADNIIDYLKYTYLYEKDTKYQENIDKIYANEYSKLFDLKNKLPKEIMFEDTYDLYDKYFELLESNKDTFKNFEYKARKENSNLSNTLDNVGNVLTELIELINDANGRHPSSLIPIEYAVLLEI